MAVTVHRLEVVSGGPDCVILNIDCSAGFYVRALAHELGERLGCGAHLAALRRTRVGDFAVEEALPLDAVERNPAQAATAIVPMAGMLPRLPRVMLSADGVRRAMNGCELSSRDSATAEWPRPGTAVQSPALSSEPLVRLLDTAGTLVGIARPAGRPGFLHPSVILM